MWTGRWLLIFMVYGCLCLFSQCICQVSLMNQMAMMRMMMMKLMWPSSKTKEQFALWKGCYACAALTLACKNFNMPSSSFLSTCFSIQPWHPLGPVGALILKRNHHLSTPLSARLFCHLCHPTPRQETLLWACAGHARATHSWALNWTILMPLLVDNSTWPKNLLLKLIFSPWSSAARSHAPATSNLASWLHFMPKMCWIFPLGLAKILFQVPLVLLVLLFP